MLTRENFVGPWAGLPVAWTAHDEFDEQTYCGDVAHCCMAGVHGVYTGGTSGEFYAQEWDEFRAIARTTVEECHRFGKPAMIGCTSTSTRGAVIRAAFAAEIGADAIQVALPFWMEVADDQVVPFFVEVARASGGLPLSVYETSRAKKRLTLDQHVRIHEAFPGYIMVKANHATIGDGTEGCRSLSAFVNVFVGEHRWAELGPSGANGSCSSAVYWNPWIILESWAKLQEGQWPSLQSHCDKLGSFFASLGKAFPNRGFMDSAYDRLAGLTTGFLRTSLKNRGPYASPTKDDIAIMRELFEAHYPEMLLGREAIRNASA
ncbi:MAG: dihydrodipicolinate synthase family protein [Pirellulales bacterium]